MPVADKAKTRILAIETSCDETAAAIVEREPQSRHVTIISSVVASQARLHAKYGGVFPEVASREHGRQILPVIATALDLPQPPSGRLPDFSISAVAALAVTVGPGLVGSLLVGTQTVAALGLATGLPIIRVNHLAGHIYASFIRLAESQILPEFPLIALIASGGHTLLVMMTEHHRYRVLGQTRDDAAGEAFDKVAKMLGLGYPGGPLVSRLAQRGNRAAYRFPIGMESDTSCDFSFSGLKTAVLRAARALPAPLTSEQKADIAASFETAVVEALILKSARAIQSYPARHFVLGGGVAANGYLRHRLGAFLAHQQPPLRLHVPPGELCTDNAAVIGAAAAFDAAAPCAPSDLGAYARLGLDEVIAPA